MPASLLCNAVLRFFGVCVLISTSGCVQSLLPVSGVTLFGRVLDRSGIPLSGVVVTDLSRSTLSDRQGRFFLASVARELYFSKPGFRGRSVQLFSEKAVRVSLLPENPEVVVGIHSPQAEASYNGLREALREVGEILNTDALDQINRLDVLILLAPDSTACTRAGDVLAWVRRGGRLIICGEWGGYPGVDADRLNDFVRPVGIRYLGNTLRDPLAPDFRLRGASVTHLPVDDVRVSFFGATGLEVRSPARAFVSVGSGVYSIQSLSPPAVIAAVAPWGLGKVFALGDTSLWRDEDSSGAGVANVYLPGHLQFLRALLEW